MVPLLLSVLLICSTGALAIALTTQATNKAEAIHLQDRQTMQNTLAGLGQQYLLFSMKEGLDYASTGTWNLRPGDAADTARLQSFVTHAVLLNYGVAVVDLGAHTLSSYAQSPAGLPPSSDPGYAPMIRALLAQRPDVSSVMTVGGLHVVAMGVPIQANGVTKAVFVGFVRLDTSPLETYVRKIHYGHTGQTYVIDSAGTVVAATNPNRIGQPFGYSRAEASVAGEKSGNYLDPRSHNVVAESPIGLGGWGGATLQSETEFYGPLQAGHLRVELAIVAVLIVAAIIVLVFNHKREFARRRLQEQLAYQAAHDSLTGLYNRMVFHERLGQALSRARRRSSGVAVLYLDLDSFKPVNDSMGHEAGDEVLVQVSERLRQVTRAEDTVARMGGDEFVILVEDVKSTDEVEALAQRLIACIHEPVALGDGQVNVAGSVGIAYSVDGQDEADALVRDADMAMYLAKDTGGNRYGWSRTPQPVG